LPHTGSVNWPYQTIAPENESLNRRRRERGILWSAGGVGLAAWRMPRRALDDHHRGT
jgi:hypothetical protein